MKMPSRQTLIAANSGHGNRGYTLAEMIIAMVLVSALMSTVWGVMSLYNGLLTTGRDRTNEQQLLRSLFEVMNEDLTAINANSTSAMLSEFGDAFDAPTADDESALDTVPWNDATDETASGQVSLTGSATAMRLQIRSLVPHDATPPSDIDLLNELGGGSAVHQQNAGRVSEFQTIVYQIVSRDQGSSVNTGAESLSPGLYRIQVDAQSITALEANQSTAELSRRVNSIEISRQNLTLLLDPQTAFASDSLTELNNQPAAQVQVDAVPEVVECRFEYFDGQSWQSAWDNNQTQRLPAAVRLSLGVVKAKDVASLTALYSADGTPPPAEETAPPDELIDSSDAYSVDARRYSRTILLDSTAPVGSGGVR